MERDSYLGKGYSTKEISPFGKKRFRRLGSNSSLIRINKSSKDPIYSEIEREFSLNMHPLIELKNRGFSNLKFAIAIPNLKILDVSYNDFVDFTGISNKLRIEELNVSFCPIASFNKATEIPTLKRLVLKGCPVCQNNLYISLALLAFGNQLRSVDSTVLVTDRNIAKAFNKQAAGLVRIGWMPNHLVTSDKEIMEEEKILSAQISTQLFEPEITKSSSAEVKRYVKPQGAISQKVILINKLKEQEALLDQFSDTESTVSSVC